MLRFSRSLRTADAPPIQRTCKLLPVRRSLLAVLLGLALSDRRVVHPRRAARCSSRRTRLLLRFRLAGVGWSRSGTTPRRRLSSASTSAGSVE